MPAAPHLFISYARKDDETFVQRLHEDLTRLGFAIWWDRESMQSRERTFLQEIRDALEGSDSVIAVIGPNAVESRFVRYEWEYARIFSKRIVPILRQGSDDLVPPELADVHRTDFRNDHRYASVLAELVRILREPLPPLGAFRATPALPQLFIPRRDEISAIVQVVRADILKPMVLPPEQQVAALIGIAGSGKSVLAAAIARATSTRRSFADGTVWLRMGQTPDVLLKVQEIRAAFRDAVLPSETLDVARARLQEVLQHKACLLVADDLWRIRDIAPILGALGPRCRLMITSRDATIATNLGARLLPIGVISDDEAGALLAAWTGDRFDVTAARRVLTEVGNMPLAVASCGAIVRDGVSWNDVIDALRNADLTFIDREFPDYPYPGVFKSLHVSADFLERSDPAAANVYRQLAVLALETGVPETTVLMLWRHGSELSERDARRLLVKLEGRGFIRLEGKEPARLVTAHSLQHNYLRAAVRDLRPLHDRLLQAYGALATEWWTTPDDGYFYEEAARHFVGAVRQEELYALVEHSRWYAVKRRLDPSLYSYIEDIKTALQSAAQREPPDTARLIAYTWLLTLVKDSAKGVPFEAIESMVLLGKTEEALRNAERIVDLNAYFWAQRRIIGLLAAAGDASRSKAVGQRMLDRVASLDNDVKRELSREVPPVAEVLRVLVSRHQAERRTTLQAMLKHYHVEPDPHLDPDREFVLLGPVEQDIDLNERLFDLGSLNRWWMTGVDFPKAAQPEPTEHEASMYGMLPLLSQTMRMERLDRELLRVAVAEVLAETGDTTRALQVASNLNNALSRLNVMALSLAAFVDRQDEEAVDLLWSQLAEVSTEKYAGATPDRVRILIRATDATTGTVLAEQAIRKAHGLSTHPGLVEALDAGRPIDETLSRELATRRGHDSLAEDIFGGGKGVALIQAKCLLAEKVAHDVTRFNEPHALLQTAQNLVRDAKDHLSDKMEEIDRLAAMCAVARAIHALGDVAGSRSLLKEAHMAAAGLQHAVRVTAMAILASTTARMGENSEAEELLDLALQHSGVVVDRTFVSNFQRAWVKALVAIGDTGRALEMARTMGNVEARPAMMSEVARSLAMSKSTALAAEIAGEIERQLSADGAAQPDPTLLVNLAIAFALAERTDSARALVHRAAAAAPAAPESRRIEALIKIVQDLAAARLYDLAFELCQTTEHAGTQAILFATFMLQAAPEAETNDEEFGNLFAWMIGAAQREGNQTYHFAIAVMIAAGALERRGDLAGVQAMLEQLLRRLEQGVSSEDAQAIEMLTAEGLISRALFALGTVGNRDGQIGTLRAANAMRLAVGLDQIPLHAFDETSVDRMWQIVRSEAAKAAANRKATEPLAQLVLAMSRSGDTEWLSRDLDRVVNSLVDEGVVDATWERIQTVAALFNEPASSSAAP